MDDGYRTSLASGLRSSSDAARLADEVAFAAARLARLGSDPPGLYAEAALDRDPEEAIWLAFLIAYLGPLEAPDPFAAVRAVRVPWAGGALPDVAGVERGPRSAHDPARGNATLAAYRAWAGRAGSQVVAVSGDPGWAPERRFDRTYERLALPGLARAARYDFLVTLGRLGVADLMPSTLALGGNDPVTVAAKRAFGIGDKMLLERRATDLAEAAGIPLEALDLGLENWALPPSAARITAGVPDAEPDPDAHAGLVSALGLESD